MDRRFIEHYEIELGHLRRMADEFKRDYPKAAGRLALGQDPPDPYVERLLEGFAFLAARVQLKLDAEFPRFTQSLIETVYPSYLAPLPAMAIIQFKPDPNDSALAAGFVLPRGSPLRSADRSESTQCVFRTAHSVRLLPIHLKGKDEAKPQKDEKAVHYFTRDLSELALPESVSAKAALRLRLKCEGGLKFNQIAFDQLVLHLPGTDELPGLLYEQIFARKTALVLQSASRPVKIYGVLPAAQIRRVGFTDEEALLPVGPRFFSGYRLLQEYFAFPKRFLFIELAGLGEAARRCPEDELDIVIPLAAADTGLERRNVDGKCFELFCTPAINLFPKDGIKVDLRRERSEFHVVPDKVKTLDFEIYSLEEVVGVSAIPGEKVPFHSFYYSPDLGGRHSAFYTTQRVPRLLTDRERRYGPVSDYFGTDLYVSLVDAEAAPYRSDLTELEIRALCTNRHLPISMPVNLEKDFEYDASAPLKAVKCLAKTEPRPSAGDGDFRWRIISHFSLNYRPLLAAEGEEGAKALRELLRIYADPQDSLLAEQIKGLQSAHARPVVRRIQVPGPISFGRGLELTVGFDEKPFAGSGVFLLGAVLEQFFARYVSLNSFTETVIATAQRGEIMRWPALTGTRQLL